MMIKIETTKSTLCGKPSRIIDEIVVSTGTYVVLGGKMIGGFGRIEVGSHMLESDFQRKISVVVGGGTNLDNEIIELL